VIDEFILKRYETNSSAVPLLGNETLYWDSFAVSGSQAFVTHQQYLNDCFCIRNSKRCLSRGSGNKRQTGLCCAR